MTKQFTNQTNHPIDDLPALSKDRLMRSMALVDQLIEERAGNLFKGPLGSVWQMVLREILRYREAIQIGARVIDRPGAGSLEFMARYLAMRCDIKGLENVPRRGGTMIVVNHPTGIADGVLVYEALKKRRPDMIFFANRDILDVVPGLSNQIIPVQWVKSKRNPEGSRHILAAASKACKEGRAVVLFPSGRLSHLTWRGLKEQPWQPTAVGLARKFDLPIVPIHLGGRNSLLFYLFSCINEELRDITLLHELLNKRRTKMPVQIGEAIDPLALPGDTQTATALLQNFVENGLKGPTQKRRTAEAFVSS